MVDSTISFKFSLMNTTRDTSSVGYNPANYDLLATVRHEINEVLGTVSAVGDSSTTIATVDLFRYSAAGLRSFATGVDAAGVPSYFSINGGVTNLAGYNSSGSGDTGDFDSTVVRVQNAFGTPGPLGIVDMGVEARMLDVVGFNRVTAVPEPETCALMLAGLGALSLLVRRRKL